MRTLALRALGSHKAHYTTVLSLQTRETASSAYAVCMRLSTPETLSIDTKSMHAAP